MSKNGSDQYDHGICEAIANIARKAVRPGTYLLVEPERWTWPCIYGMYWGLTGSRTVRTRTNRVRRSPIRQLLSSVTALAKKNQETMDAHLLVHVPDLERRLVARFLKERARAEIGALDAARAPRIFEGPLPGRRLPVLNGRGGGVQMETDLEALCRIAKPAPLPDRTLGALPIPASFSLGHRRVAKSL